MRLFHQEGLPRAELPVMPVVSYPATLDVPIETVARVLRWLKDDTKLHLLPRDARVSQATAYRYLHEAIDVIAAHAPDLPEVLTAGSEAGWGFVCLDGTLIESSRSSAKSAVGQDVRYLGKHYQHGGNV